MTAPVTAAFPPQPPFPPPWRPPGPPAPRPPGPAPATPVPGNPAFQPSRIWLDPGAAVGGVYERLLQRRIVMASGHLDGERATQLCAQLLSLDADGDTPIRLEIQSLAADLPAALTVMGVLDTLRVPVHAQAGGRVGGPALGILASATHRRAYPNALFALSEPRVSFDGTVTSVASQEEQLRVMLDQLFIRLAEVTGREVDEIRADARRERLLTVDEAIAYGLIESRAGDV